MKFLGFNFGSVERMLKKGVKSRKRKSKILSRLHKMVSGLRKEETALNDVRAEMLEMVQTLQAEDKVLEMELNAISTVRSNVENLLAIKSDVIDEV